MQHHDNEISGCGVSGARSKFIRSCKMLSLENTSLQFVIGGSCIGPSMQLSDDFAGNICCDKLHTLLHWDEVLPDIYCILGLGDFQMDLFISMDRLEAAREDDFSSNCDICDRMIPRRLDFISYAKLQAIPY